MDGNKLIAKRNNIFCRKGKIMITQIVNIIAQGTDPVISRASLNFLAVLWGLIFAPVLPIRLRRLINNKPYVKRWESIYMHFVAALILWIFSQARNANRLISSEPVPLWGMICVFLIIFACICFEKYQMRVVDLTTSKLGIAPIFAYITHVFSLLTLILLLLPKEKLIAEIFIFVCFLIACFTGSYLSTYLKVESWFTKQA